MGKTTLVEWKINNMLTHSLCLNLKELEMFSHNITMADSDNCHQLCYYHVSRVECVELQLPPLTSYEHCAFLNCCFSSQYYFTT